LATAGCSLTGFAGVTVANYYMLEGMIGNTAPLPVKAGFVGMGAIGQLLLVIKMLNDVRGVFSPSQD